MISPCYTGWRIKKTTTLMWMNHPFLRKLEGSNLGATATTGEASVLAFCLCCAHSRFPMRMRPMPTACRLRPSMNHDAEPLPLCIPNEYCSDAAGEISVFSNRPSCTCPGPNLHAVGTNGSIFHRVRRQRHAPLHCGASPQSWYFTVAKRIQFRTYIRQIIRTDVRSGNWPLFVL